MKKSIFLFALLAIGFAALAILFSAHDVLGASLAIAPIISGMSRQQLEDFAMKSLTDEYEGNEYEGFDDLDDDDMYEGYDDDMISFLGTSRSFLDEKKSGVYLTFVLVNNSGYTKTICLNPAYFNTQGVTCVGGKGSSMTDVVLNNTSIDRKSTRLNSSH